MKLQACETCIKSKKVRNKLFKIHSRKSILAKLLRLHVCLCSHLQLQINNYSKQKTSLIEFQTAEAHLFSYQYHCHLPEELLYKSRKKKDSFLPHKKTPHTSDKECGSQQTFRKLQRVIWGGRVADGGRKRDCFMLNPYKDRSCNIEQIVHF